MRKSVKLAMVAAMAAAFLAAAVGSASAGRLEPSSLGFLAQWRSLEFVSPIGVTIRCPVTLDGSFHSRTIQKIERSLIGYITLAIVHQAACTSGRGAAFNGSETYNGTTTPQTLPWHLTYESFRGILPNIESIRVLLARLRFGLTVPGICTGQYGTATDNLSGDIALSSGVATTLTPTRERAAASLSRTDGGICPARGTMENTANVTQLTSNTRITVRLI